jgi:hypothetical protein
MVNNTLFKSAAFCSVYQIVGLFYLQPPQLYTLFILGGCATSLLNHGTTYKYIQLLDRSYMLLGVPITYLTAPSPILKVAPALAVLLYLLGKYQKHDIYHIAAHMLISTANICICFQL